MKFKKMLLIGINEPKLDAEYWQELDALAEKKVFLPKEDSRIQNELTDTDCLLLNFGVPITKKDIDSASKLRYIGTLSVAFGKIDIEYAKKRGIPVCNIAGYCTESVAEFVFAVVLEQMRELERAKKQAREGNYSEEDFVATEIRGKTVGILGLGNIGRRVAEIAQGFGANVIYWSRKRKKDLEAKGIRFETAENVIAKSDILTLHFAQTKETENFLNEKTIPTIKKGCVIVNTAPMELADIPSLVRRLAKGDVTFIFDHSDEMSKENLALLSKYPACIIYPPIAYVSEEARIAKQELFVGNIQNFLNGTPTNQVN